MVNWVSRGENACTHLPPTAPSMQMSGYSQTRHRLVGSMLCASCDNKLMCVMHPGPGLNVQFGEPVVCENPQHSKRAYVQYYDAHQNGVGIINAGHHLCPCALWQGLTATLSVVIGEPVHLDRFTDSHSLASNAVQVSIVGTHHCRSPQISRLDIRKRMRCLRI